MTKKETQHLTDAIDQADWLAEESGYPTPDELWLADPDLFVTLAQEWRASHQDGGCYA